MDNLIVCRCEEVYLQQIEEAKNSGLVTAQEIKMATRLGMGICQGRMCRVLVERVLNADSVISDGQPSSLTIHKPVRPVSLAQAARIGVDSSCE